MPKDKGLELVTEETVKVEPAPVAVAPALIVVEPTMTFDVWFSSLGRPQHHKAGMKAYARTEGRRTKSGWELLFRSY